MTCGYHAGGHHRGGGLDLYDIVHTQTGRHVSRLVESSGAPEALDRWLSWWEGSRHAPGRLSATEAVLWDGGIVEVQERG